VSSGAAREGAAERHGLPALETAVGRAVDELRELRKRSAEAARRSAALEELLATFQSGADSPERMKERLERLEGENRDLRARISRGRESVERLLARIQFLEDKR
jgi:predicted RNase H-like nuclease (RuvC/YqgF family)